MTQEQFNDTRFGAGMKIRLKTGQEKLIIAVDFEECLFGISYNNTENLSDNNNHDLNWIRCENVELVN